MAFAPNQRLECADLLLERLKERGAAPGERLPGESVLCRDLGVSRHLVRLALQYLEQEGFIERRSKSGSYLIRPPSAGPVAMSARSIAPVRGHSRTLCLMLSGSEDYAVLRHLQQQAIGRGFMLQPYFAAEHANRADEERRFLEQALREGYRGAVLHPTPLNSGNDDLFRALSSQLRLAHISFHSEQLPEQSFFLPDYRLGGAQAAACLLSRGCRRLALATGLPVSHHVSQLLASGFGDVVSAAGIPVDHEGDMLDWNDHVKGAIRAWAELGSELGIACYSRNTLTFIRSELQAAGIPPQAWPAFLIIRDEQQHDLTEAGILQLAFDWKTRAADALDFVMGDSNALQHRLYAPKLLPG